jgi:hypothetical protein
MVQIPPVKHDHYSSKKETVHSLTAIKRPTPKFGMVFFGLRFKFKLHGIQTFGVGL